MSIPVDTSILISQIERAQEQLMFAAETMNCIFLADGELAIDHPEQFENLRAEIMEALGNLVTALREAKAIKASGVLHGDRVGGES